MTHARTHRRWLEARNRFLRDLALTVMTLLMTLIKVLQTHDWVLPAALIGASLFLTWFAEDFLHPVHERCLLSLAVLVQALMFWEHFGGPAALFLSAASLAFVWREELATRWRAAAQGPLATPHVVKRTHAKAGGHATALLKTARRAIRRVPALRAKHRD